MMRSRQVVRLGVGALFLALATGCLQLDTTIRLHEDGSATITERLNFSKRLLDADSGRGILPELLTKAAALERARELGAGVTLVSHAVTDGEQGSRESRCTYRIPDIEDLTYTSPFPADRSYPGHLRIKLRPYLKHGWATRWPAGALIVDATAAYPETSTNNPSPAFVPEEDRPTVAPAELQAYRELAPIARDQLRGFQLRVRLETYAPVVSTRNLVHRGRAAAVSYIDLLSVTDRDLDKYGYSIFENEELMLDVLRWQHSSDRRRIDLGKTIVDQLAGQGSNLTLPVYHGGGGGYLLTRPSRQLFDRYFAGKMLENRGGAYAADFEEIGHHPGRGVKQK